MVKEGWIWAGEYEARLQERSGKGACEASAFILILKE